jgi:ParB family chromosome partitioning protein
VASGGGRHALGRGLSALISEGQAAEIKAGEGRLREIAIEEIGVSPRQPRRAFATEELEELAASIRHLGVVQPIVLRPAAEGAAKRYELIAGERRLRAAALAGLAVVPALVRPADEVSSLEIALAENVAREDLNSIEEAQAYAALVDEFGLTHERIGELVGRSRVAVTNLLRLLELPDEVQALIERGDLSEGHGRALLSLEEHQQRRKVARHVAKEGLSVRQTEALVRRLAATAAAGGPSPRSSGAEDFAELADELYGLLEAPVRISSGARGGRVEIRFKDRADLERLIALLRSLAQ